MKKLLIAALLLFSTRVAAQAAFRVPALQLKLQASSGGLFQSLEPGIWVKSLDGRLWYHPTNGVDSLISLATDGVVAGSPISGNGTSASPLSCPTCVTSGSATAGDLLYAASGSWALLSDVAVGSFLRSGGVGTAPLWSTTTWPNSATTGDVLYANATNGYSNLSDVAVGSYMRSGGVGTAPLWSTLTLPNAATLGDVFYASSTNTMGRLADVALGSFLRSGGVGSAPAWSTTTWPNSATQGDLCVATGTNAFGTLADVAVNEVLLSGGVGVAPSYGQVPSAALADLTPSPAGTYSIATVTVNSKGQVTGASSGTSVPWDAQGTFNLNTNDTNAHTLASYIAGGSSTFLAVEVRLVLYDTPNNQTRSTITIFNWTKIAGTWTLTETNNVNTGTSVVINSLAMTVTSGTSLNITVHPGFANNYSWKGYYTVVTN